MLVNKDEKTAHIMHRSLIDTFKMYKETVVSSGILSDLTYL
jgi:hypothetical protein